MKLSYEIKEWFLIGFVILFSPVILPLWIAHIVVVNYFPCSIFGKLTEYAHCDDSSKK